jgi:hypothetical protein
MNSKFKMQTRRYRSNRMNAAAPFTSMPRDRVMFAF